MPDSPNVQRQVIRFAVVGLTSNAVLYLSYLALTNVGLGPKLSMSLVYAVGVGQTYLFNKRWTFTHKGRRDAAFLRYLIVYAGGYLTNLLVLAWLVDARGLPHRPVQGVMILFLAVALFLLQRLWVFRTDSTAKP